LRTPEARLDGAAVLVVEDEFLIAMDLQDLLERHGWRVLGPATTVPEALHLLDGTPPDVALLDVSLRRQLVTPVVERLRVLRIPFVLATAYAGPQLADLGLGGCVHVTKPFHVQRLLGALAQVVATSRSSMGGRGAWR
jgi:CheY-like chemotaxis protein